MLLLLFNCCVSSCKKTAETPDEVPIDTLVSGPTFEKSNIIGWWHDYKASYRDGSGMTILSTYTQYFGADSFYFQDNLGFTNTGSSTGIWWWSAKDSITVETVQGATGKGRGTLHVSQHLLLHHH